MSKSLRLFSCLFAVVLFILPLNVIGNDGRFVLVIDPGHGGKDAGAVGAFSKEKDINLNVALELGRLVETNNPHIKVIYTRRTDVFIPLQERANIANRNKADLFISIHTNSLPAGRLAYGSETYSLGMARATANLEVAKRENSVISLEAGYEQRYQGFDPNKAESYVIFEFMQDKYMKQSIDLASAIQRNYVLVGRKNKGVHQAGFLVLRETSMPAVLTELGFISTPEEERYLNSRKGIEELARSIYNGFAEYKNKVDKTSARVPILENNFKGQEHFSYALQRPEEGEKIRSTQAPVDSISATTAIPPAPERSVEGGKPEFRIQILITDRPLSANDSRLKGVKATYYQEGAAYKYTYGATGSYTEALRLFNIIRPNFPDAFIIALQDGKRINLMEARRAASKK